MMTDELEESIISLQEHDCRIKFIYVIPDFQNPAGITIPEQRRIKIIEIAEIEEGVKRLSRVIHDELSGK